MKEELNANFMQTLQTSSLTKDQEKYDPNINMVEYYQLPAQMGNVGINPAALIKQKRLATKQIHYDTMLTQLLQHMQTMQAQISCLSSNCICLKDNGA